MKKPRQNFKLKPMSLLVVILTLLSSLALAQERTLKGKVTSMLDDTPLPGVNVLVKDSNSGTITDVDGNYVISANDTDILIFSYVGFTPEEVPVNTISNGFFNIALAEDIESLSEVVVIGYGVTKKRDVTSAISSVSGEDLEGNNVAGFDQAIAGKMAGVRVSAGNASPGGGQNVMIRGMGSINASSAPLYVIDGMPMPDSYNKNENPLNAINPNDIESIEVLKDASSSAIYGARASNGVVLITTKRGKSGKPIITFSSSQGVQSITNNIDMLNSADFKQYLKDSRSQAYILQDPFLWDDTRRSHSWSTPNDVRLENLYFNNSEGIQNEKRIERWFVVSDTIANDPDDTDWIDEITRLGRIQDYQLAASGGTDNVNYRISGNYFDQDGIVKNSGYTRFAARANVDLKVSERIKLGINIAPSYEIFDKLDRMEGSDGPNGLFGNALVMPPIYAPFDENGDPAYLGSVPNGPYDYNLGGRINPYRMLEIKTLGNNMRNLGSIYGEVKIIEGLTFRSEFHSEILNRIGEFYTPSTTPTTGSVNSISVGSNERQNRIYLNTQNILTYSKAIKNHSFSVMGGYQAEKTSWKNDYIRKSKFFVDEITTLNNSSTIDNPLNDARSNEGNSTMIGVFGRLTYNYNSKYYLTASFRKDGSSKFGTENKWGNFPSFSAAWRVTDEPFMSGIKNVLTDWKIRGGWGKVGNSSIDDYLALNRLQYSDYNLGGNLIIGTNDVGIAYTGLGWETTEDFNVGTDIQLFGGRIAMEYDYFIRKTTDMLYNVALVAHTGFGSQVRNISAMENRGMEFAIHTRNTTGAFKWNTDFNIYYTRNKVLDLGPQKSPLVGIDTRSEEGKPLSNIWGFAFLGPYKDWEAVKTNPIIIGGNIRTRSIPGDAQFADVNMDGVIDAAGDQTVLGNAQPDFVYGITNNFYYKDFDLSVQVNAVRGGDINIRTFRREVFGGNSGLNNVPQFYFDDYWTPDRPDAKYEAPNRKSSTKVFGTTSQNVEKASFVNISNITLGYNLPSGILNNRVNNFRVFASIQNAFIFTKYHGFNPESNVGGIDARTQGVDETSYPLARTMTLGLNLSF